MKNFKIVVLIITIVIMAMFTTSHASQKSVSPESDRNFAEMEKAVNKSGRKVNYCNLPTLMLESIIWIKKMNDFDSRTSTQYNMAGDQPYIRLKNLLILIACFPDMSVSGIKMKAYDDVYMGISIKTPGNPAVGFLFTNVHNELHIKYLVKGGQAELARTQMEVILAGNTLENFVKTLFQNAAKSK